jgi:hypothetical protein
MGAERYAGPLHPDDAPRHGVRLAAPHGRLVLVRASHTRRLASPLFVALGPHALARAVACRESVARCGVKLPNRDTNDDLLPNRAGDAERALRAAKAGVRIPVPCPKPVRVAEKDRPLRQKNRKPLKRTRMKSRGPRTKKSGGALFPKGVDEPYREWIRALPCILAGRTAQVESWPMEHRCLEPIQSCHVKSRGAGGGDRNNLYPGCVVAHHQQHLVGIRSFEHCWDVSLKTIARQLTAVYEAEHFPCP